MNGLENDPLTGIANISELEMYLDETLNPHSKDTLGLAIVDIEGFTKYNDEYGIRQGNLALCRLTESLQAMEGVGLVARVCEEKRYTAVVYELLSKEEFVAKIRLIKETIEGIDIPRVEEERAEPDQDDGYRKIKVDVVGIWYNGIQDINSGKLITKAKEALDDKESRTSEVSLIE